MRRLLLLFAVTTLPVHALDLTVLLDVDQNHSQRALTEMRKELAKVFKPTNVTIDVKLRQESKPHETYSDVVMVKLRGTCRMESFAPLLDERGPFAWTHTVDGKVLPFSEVACDHIARSIRAAMPSEDSRDRDRLFGRALARVMAHEIVHMLGKCTDHGQTGVFRHALSGRQLIADKLELNRDDIARLP